MASIKSIVAAVALAGALLVIAIFAFGGSGPSSALIKSSMIKELGKRNKDCVVTQVTFIRAGSFVPEAHRHLPKGTVFYPIRVQANFTALQHDGSRSDPQKAVKTLYFYKTETRRWAYEVNSF